MPPTPKHDRPEVQNRIINQVLLPNLDPKLVAIYPHEAFDNKPRLRTDVSFIMGLSTKLCEAVKDQSGAAPRLSPTEIRDADPKTVNDLVSLVYNRLRNRDLAFVEDQVMNVLKGLDGNVNPNTTFASLGWNGGVVENVIRSIRRSMAWDIRFDTSIKDMKAAKNGSDLIDMICRDFVSQNRQ